MNASPDAESLCRAFSLGRPLAPTTATEGGFSHRVWRLRTEAGVFAIKQLNPNVAARSGALDRFRASERVAAAFSAAGVRVVVARNAATDPLREVCGTWFLAYPWVEGASVGLSRVTVDHARAVGSILGRLHQRNLAHPDLPGPSRRSVSAEQWRESGARVSPWSEQLDDAMPVVLALSADCVAAADALREEPTLVSHRDLVPQNVLWDAKDTWLIDWEGAAWTNPMVEPVSATIDWSGYMEGRTDQAIFEAVLDGYRAVAPFDAAKATQALPVSTASWLRWLAYSVSRASGESASGDEERALGVSQTFASLSALAKIPAHQPVVAAVARPTRRSEIPRPSIRGGARFICVG